MRWMAWSGLLVIVACGGSTDDEGLFGNKGGSSGSTAGSGGASGSKGGTGGVPGGTGGTVDAGLGGGPSGSGGGGTSGGGTSGGGTSGASGGVGGESGTGGAPVDAGPEYTLANVCQKLSVETCALRQACCQSTVGFNSTECVARETADCNADVAEVNASQRVFNPDQIKPCLAAVQPLYKKCLFSGEDYVAYLKARNICSAIFDSKAGPGSPCSDSSDCASSTVQNGFSFCSTQGQCGQSTFGQLGENCSQKYCDDGLTCMYVGTSTTPTCQPKTPVGGSCTTSMACGYGYYCPQGVNTCQPAQSGGHSCSNDLHCKTLDCNNGFCTYQGTYGGAQACGM